MPNLQRQQQYSSIAIRKYIAEKYNSQEFRLLCHNDDEEQDHLGKCYDDLGEDKIFEIKVLEIIGFAERRNKFDKLVNLLKNQRADLDEYIRQGSDPFSSKPTLTSYRNINEGSFGISNKLRAGFAPASQPEIVGDSMARVMETSPQLERIFQDIAHLEQNMASIGEIDELLGAIDDLLNNMRQKISSLLVDIKVKHQRLHDERLASIEKPTVPQRGQSASFQLGHSTIARQQLVSRPDAGSRWPQDQYPKTNYGQEKYQ